MKREIIRVNDVCSRGFGVSEHFIPYGPLERTCKPVKSIAISTRPQDHQREKMIWVSEFVIKRKDLFVKLTTDWIFEEESQYHSIPKSRVCFERSPSQSSFSVLRQAERQRNNQENKKPIKDVRDNLWFSFDRFSVQSYDNLDQCHRKGWRIWKNESTIRSKKSILNRDDDQKHPKRERKDWWDFLSIFWLSLSFPLFSVLLQSEPRTRRSDPDRSFLTFRSKIKQIKRVLLSEEDFEERISFCFSWTIVFFDLQAEKQTAKRKKAEESHSSDRSNLHISVWRDRFCLFLIFFLSYHHLDSPKETDERFQPKRWEVQIPKPNTLDKTHQKRGSFLSFSSDVFLLFLFSSVSPAEPHTDTGWGQNPDRTRVIWNVKD